MTSKNMVMYTKASIKILSGASAGGALMRAPAHTRHRPCPAQYDKRFVVWRKARHSQEGSSSKGHGDFKKCTVLVIDAYLAKLCLSRHNCLALSATVSSCIFNGKYRSSSFRVPYETFETVVCPTNTGVHWILLILKPFTKKIIVYDSLTANLQLYKDFLRNWRAFLQAVKRPDYQLWELVVESNQKQQDSYNCGVFCMLFADYYLSQQSVTDFSKNPTFMEDYRFKIALELMESSDSVVEFCGVCNQKTSDKDEENIMACCDQCCRWIHLKCIQTDATSLLQHKGYKCIKCI